MAALTADLYVEERWRRHEAGFALVREAEARMRRKGLIRVATGALAASERAARLYERWGSSAMPWNSLRMPGRRNLGHR